MLVAVSYFPPISFSYFSLCQVKVEFLERVRANEERGGGGKLKRERLKELKEMFEARKIDELKWVFDDDVEMNELWFNGENEGWGEGKKRRNRSEAEVIRFLVDRFAFNFLFWVIFFFLGLCEVVIFF